MKKAVFFPSTGYTCKEELFQLLEKELEKIGWSVILLDWTEIPFKTIETINEAADIATGYAICSLKDESLDGEMEILFVSKSIGCICALRYATLLKLKNRHVLLTPTP